jgi:hypothetical protein
MPSQSSMPYFVTSTSNLNKTCQWNVWMRHRGHWYMMGTNLSDIQEIVWLASTPIPGSIIHTDNTSCTDVTLQGLQSNPVFLNTTSLHSLTVHTTSSQLTPNHLTWRGVVGCSSKHALIQRKKRIRARYVLPLFLNCYRR